MCPLPMDGGKRGRARAAAAQQLVPHLMSYCARSLIVFPINDLPVL